MQKKNALELTEVPEMKELLPTDQWVHSTLSQGLQKAWVCDFHKECYRNWTEPESSTELV